MRKIIHIDMDCFYAAIEVRDNPALAHKPVAVGGAADKRGVLCTCNYEARQYGVHSAMSTATAMRLCPELILLPVNMEKYRQASKGIHRIFKQYTELVEPLSLDEAYLDVSTSAHQQGSATLIAQAIRQQIWHEQQLTASAGVAPNKFLAKIASDWRKPNGQFVIRPQDIDDFMVSLPVNKLFGVGKVTAKKLQTMGLCTCADLQKLSLTELVQGFGKFGQRLYEQCRGIDQRVIQPHRERKSLSVEHTFAEDLDSFESCTAVLAELYQRLLHRIERSAKNHPIKNQFIKIKYSDFKQETAQMISTSIHLSHFETLLQRCYQPSKQVRLLGIGVQFVQVTQHGKFVQESLLL